jgi:hypothetical protein
MKNYIFNLDSWRGAVRVAPCKPTGCVVSVMFSKHICNPPPPPIYCGVYPSMPQYIVVYDKK